MSPEMQTSWQWLLGGAVPRDINNIPQAFCHHATGFVCVPFGRKLLHFWMLNTQI